GVVLSPSLWISPYSNILCHPSKFHTTQIRQWTTPISLPLCLNTTPTLDLWDQTYALTLPLATEWTIDTIPCRQPRPRHHQTTPARDSLHLVRRTKLFLQLVSTRHTAYHS